MRQFLLAGNANYASGSDLLKVAEGAIGVFYNNNGALAVTSTGAEIKDEAMIVLGRKAENGGPVVLPLFKNNFSYSKMVYQPSSKFKVNITIPAANKIGDYTLVVVLKGVKFNERNKWTAMVHNTDTTTTAAVMAEKLKNAINSNNGENVTATNSGATLTIEGNQKGVDFEVIGADELMNVTTLNVKTGTATNGVTIVTRGDAGWGNAEYISDLASKAAADAGFEYTYRDANADMYPNYPLNALAQANSADNGFTIFTLRFAEPRKVATTDEVVNQIVQVAFPSGASNAIGTFENICDTLSNIVSEATALEE